MDHTNLTEVKKRIEKVNQSASKKLDLYGLRLTNVPEEVWELTNLTELKFYYNQLKSLPSEIGFLTNLSKLYISTNQLVRLPPEIGFLTNLTELYLPNNQLRSLPEEIGFLTNLTELDLYNNQLRSLPEEIRLLTNLTYLNIWNNPELVYPPYSMIKFCNVAKEVLEFCKTHNNIFTRRGRRKNMWECNKLMYIAQVDPQCSETFGKLPVELIVLIEYFCIGEPYVEPKETDETDIMKRPNKKIKIL